MVGEKARKAIIEEMKRRVKAAYMPRDILLVLGESTVRSTEKAINNLFERLQEWYSLYFPELKMEDRVKYCKLAVVIDKEKTEESERKVKEIMGEKGDEIMRQLRGSGGIDLTAKDLSEIKGVAQELLELTTFQERLERYMEGIAREVCPNLSEVGGAKIAAKLVAHVGGLERLAKLPASTIQVLGAEKALFKHLRRKTKPPKHGIIFQHTAIHSAPKEQRGKIARAIATKLAIAAKADAYTKHFIGKKLREDFERRLKEIKGGKE